MAGLTETFFAMLRRFMTAQLESAVDKRVPYLSFEMSYVPMPRVTVLKMAFNHQLSCSLVKTCVEGFLDSTKVR